MSRPVAEGLDLNDGATITVTYTAHLNDKAYVNTGSGSTENKNSVQLQYSNNPRPGEYWGTTPKSEVYSVHLPAEQHQACRERTRCSAEGRRLLSVQR